MIHDNDPLRGPAGQQPSTQRDPFGRLGSGDGSQEKLKAIAGLANIKAAVGYESNNNPDDVARVEMLLENAGDMDLKPSEGPTGYVGQRLLDALMEFQKRNGLPATGIVRPGDATHRALAGFANPRGGMTSGPGGEPGASPMATPGPQPRTF